MCVVPPEGSDLLVRESSLGLVDYVQFVLQLSWLDPKTFEENVWRRNRDNKKTTSEFNTHMQTIERWANNILPMQKVLSPKIKLHSGDKGGFAFFLRLKRSREKGSHLHPMK